MKKNSVYRTKSQLGMLTAASLLLLTGACVPWDSPDRPVKYTTVSEAVAAGGEAHYLSFYEHAPAITNFPKAVYEISSLTRLSFRKNKIPVPTGISALAKLEWLDLGEMGISTLPDDFGALGALHTLYLSDNALSSLPVSLAGLTQLRYINLDRNALTALPAEIAQCQNLKWLRLNNNALTTLPSEIGSLQLERLYLRHNKLTSLPASIQELDDTLTELFLEGNPLSQDVRDSLATMLPSVQIYF